LRSLQTEHSSEMMLRFPFGMTLDL